MKNTLLLLAVLLFSCTTSQADDCNDWGGKRPEKCRQRDQEREVERFYNFIKPEAKDFKAEVWEKALDEALKKDLAKHVRYLLSLQKRYASKIPFDINAKDEARGGKTRLHSASAGGHAIAIPVLLEFGADVNSRDKAGNSPLHDAVRAGMGKSVAALMQAKDINPNAENERGERPLSEALISGNVDVLGALEPHAAKLDLNFKIKSRKQYDKDSKRIDVAATEFILETDSLVGLRIAYPKLDPKNLPVDGTGRPLLHSAAYFNSPKITKYLLSTVKVDPLYPHVKGDAAKKTESITYAVDIAAGNGFYEVLSAYLDRDPKLLGRQESKSGDTMLHSALERGNTEMADFLLKRQPPLNVLNSKGFTPIDLVQDLKKTYKAPDQKDLLAKYEGYEKELNKRGSKSGVRIFEEIIKKEDTKAIASAAMAMQPSELAALVRHLIKLKKPKMIRAAVKANRFANEEEALATPFLSILQESPDIFEEKNWDSLDALVNSGKGTNGIFRSCVGWVNTYCPTWAMLEGDPKVVERLLKTRQDIQLNFPYRQSANLLTGQNKSVSLLDRVEGGLQDPLSPPWTRAKTTNAYSRYEADKIKKRLEPIKKVLVKNGALSRADALKIFNEVKQAMFEGKTEDVLKKYSPKLLIQLADDYDQMKNYNIVLTTLLEWAVVYGDEAMVKALTENNPAPLPSNMAPIKRFLEFAAIGKIREQLVKAGHITGAPIECAYLDASYYAQKIEFPWKKWFESEGLKNCKKENNSVLETLFQTPELRKDKALWDALAKNELARQYVKEDSQQFFLSQLISQMSCWGGKENENLETTEFLLKAGVDPNKTSARFGAEGAKVLDSWLSGLSACKNSEEMLALLLKYGAEPKLSRGGESSFAHRFAKYINGFKDDPDSAMRIFKMLAEKGEDLKAISQKGKTLVELVENYAWSKDESKQFLSGLIELGVSPFHKQACNTPDYLTASPEIAKILWERKQKKRELEKMAGCFSIELTATAEYLSTLAIFDRFVGRIKKVILEHREDKDGIDWSWAEDVEEFKYKVAQGEHRLSSGICCEGSAKIGCQLLERCTNIEPKELWEETRVLCNLFPAKSDEQEPRLYPSIDHGLSVNDLAWVPAKVKQAYKKKTRFDETHFNMMKLRLLLENDAAFEVAVSIQEIEGLSAKQQLDLQIPGLYKAAHLSSQMDYLSWRYPQCAAEFAAKQGDKNVKPGVTPKPTPKASPKPAGVKSQ